MARAFRILPDYKRLPPLPRRPRLHKFALRPPSRSGGALIPPHPAFPFSPADPFLFFIFFFPHVRLQSDAVAAASSDSIAESLIPNWSDPNFGAAARPLSLDTPLISLPLILCFALPTSESRISDKYNVDYFFDALSKKYNLANRQFGPFFRDALFFASICNNNAISDTLRTRSDASSTD